MQITANQPLNLTSQPAENPPVAKMETFPAPPVKDTVSVDRVSSLLSALQTNPKIRPEVVERGRLLALNPNYPEAEVINKLAGLVVSGNSDV